MMSRMCPKCGAELRDGELFCCECGTKYAEPAPPEPEAAAFCPKCGTQLRPGTAFCPNCGAPQQADASARPARERPAAPAARPGGSRTAIIIAAIAAFTVIAVVLVLWLAGVFGGREGKPDESQPSGSVITGTDWDDVINIGGDESPAEELSFPAMGYAALISEPGAGALSRVESRGGSSWAVYYTGVPVEQGKLYYADIRAAGFAEDETIDDQTASGGRYAVRAFNSGGVMFEMVCQGGNMGLYIGEKYD